MPDPSPLKQIRTYQGDVADALQTQHESLNSIREKEIARQSLIGESVTVAPPAASRRRIAITILLVIGSLVLLGAGGYAAWLSYSTYREKTAVPMAVIPASQLIPVEHSTTVPTAGLTTSTIVEAIRNVASTSLPVGAITQIHLVRPLATSTVELSSSELLALLGAGAPAYFVRALDPVFMLGLVGKGLTETPGTFLIIRLASYPNAFAGMLGWENHLPLEETLGIFADASTTASIATATTTPSFADETINNRDIRVLRDPSGKDVLLYSFFNQTDLILTDDERDLDTLVGLLTAQELSR